MIGLEFNNATSRGDLIYDEGIQDDATLKTAILISLFTWRRANPDDDIPSDEQPHGWWGDTFAEVPGDLTGSRLWQLNGRPLNTETINLAGDFVKEALQWMIDDSVAESVEPGEFFIQDKGVYLKGLYIKRPTDLAARYYDIWEGTLAN